MKLRQVETISHQASWKEYFYDGELQVVNGETETDNPYWIEHLRLRGFKPLDEIPENIKHFGVVKTEDSVEPLGTQVAQTADTEAEREHVEELIEERPPVDQETVETVEENSVEDKEEPQDDTLKQLLQGKAPTRTPRPPRRKNVKV